MIYWLVLLLGALVTTTADAQTLAREYNTEGDKSGAVSVFGFYSPTTKRTYVLDGEPGSFAIPVTGTFTQGPVEYLRNGSTTQAAIDTATPANNRPLPFTLLAGDALGPVSVGSGNTAATTLRFRLVDDQTLAVSGPLTDAQLRASPFDVNVAASVLPDGAASESTLSDVLTTANSIKQDTGDSLAELITANGTLSSIEGEVANIDSKITIANTDAVTVVSSALPTGAATEATLASIDTKTPALVSGRVPVDGSGVTQPVSGTVALSGTSAVNVAQVNGNTTLTGYGTGTNALRTTAMLGIGSSAVSDTNAVPVTVSSVSASFPVYQEAGSGVQLTSSSVLPYFQDFSSANLSTTYTQVVASTASRIRSFYATNNSATAIYIAVGAAASEIVQYIVMPGESTGRVIVDIPSGRRIAIRTQTGTLTDGQFSLNVFTN